MSSGSGGRGIFGRAFLLLYSIAWRSLDKSWVMRKVGEIILSSILAGMSGREGTGAAQMDNDGQHHEVCKTRCGSVDEKSREGKDRERVLTCMLEKDGIYVPLYV